MPSQLRNLFLLISVLPLLAACQKPEAPAAETPVRPVKTMVVAGGDTGGLRQFPARIDSLNKADLAFRVPGKVKEILVVEGQHVEKGQLLARLDDTDYRIVVKDRQASFDKARQDFARAKKLIKEGYISRTDYDKLEAAYKSAKAALEAAKQDLAYTDLKAPFAGTVAKRYVEQFEEVQPNQPVLALSDTSLLKVIFDVPENIIQTIKRSGKQHRVEVWATFDALPNERFPLKFLEVSTRADPQTQTFKVTFTMPRPEQLNILPGMTASVTVDLSRVVQATKGFRLPLTAVTADAALEPIVWIVDGQLVVHSRKVKLGEMQGAGVQVLAGLEKGMRVVTAGTPYLAEGMKVRLMPEKEQAEPRLDDLRQILLTRCPPAKPASCNRQQDEGADAR